jgi:hypothetical protein
MLSCISYEPLQIYKHSFVSNSDCLNTNGYYLAVITPVDEPTLTMIVYRPIFFYEDGSFIFGSYYSDTSLMEKEIINYPKGMYSWGFYICEDSVIKSEFIEPDYYNYSRIFLKFKIYPNKLIDQYDGEYNFVPFEHKPDSTNNWLKNHRRYKISDSK